MMASHYVTDLNILAKGVSFRNHKPVAPHVEGWIHRWPFTPLYGNDVLPNPGAGAEDTGAIQYR